MAEGELRIDTVLSKTTDVRGRALNSARGQHFVVDAQAGPAEALLPVEVFLAGISACGVHLLERFADERGVPLRRAEIEIEGRRNPAQPNRFYRLARRCRRPGPSPALPGGVR